MPLFRMTVAIVCGLLLMDIAATMLLDWREASGMQALYHACVMQCVVGIFAGASLLWIVYTWFEIGNPKD